jgi:glucose-6-phosphate-specific signal transduction histidine kinase
MSSFRKITARDKPEALAKAAAEHEEHLRLALAIAIKRAYRSAPLVRDLLARATVEGLSRPVMVKASAVSFRVHHLKQTWHQLLPWKYFANSTPAETATLIASSLRESIRYHQSRAAVSSKANPRSIGSRDAPDA